MALPALPAGADVSQNVRPHGEAEVAPNAGSMSAQWAIEYGSKPGRLRRSRTYVERQAGPDSAAAATTTTGVSTIAS